MMMTKSNGTDDGRTVLELPLLTREERGRRRKMFFFFKYMNRGKRRR